MQITLSLIVLLLGFIISASFFGAVLLWFSQQNRLSNRFLAALILAIALWLIDHFLRIAGIYNLKPEWYFSPIFFSFAFGPLIYFYVKSLVSQPFVFQKQDFLHFIPVVLQFLLYLFLSLQDYAFKNWYWENIHQYITYKIEFDGTWLSLIIYLLLSIRLIKKYQIYISNHFSETSRIRLNWG
jgi:hypothetical protein